MKTPLLPLLLAVGSLTACHRSSPESNKPDASPPAVATDLEREVQARGRAATARAFSILSSNLVTALSRGGPTNALSFCSVNAEPLTVSASPTPGVVVRRVSHRARNPGNQAGEAELAVLRRFHAVWQRGEKPSPVIATNSAGDYVFYAPIGITNAVCLICHGRPGVEVQPDTLALIRKLYPADQATGFAMGDLRGMWRVDIRRDAVAPSR